MFEFVIKIYPDGAFSQFLEHKVSIGDRLEVEAPFGTCTLRENRTSDIVFIGGGAGMAPMLGLLRALAEKDGDRKARLYYGARTKDDLCFEDELRALEEKIPGFKYVPALSHHEGATTGTGRRA